MIRNITIASFIALAGTANAQFTDYVIRNVGTQILPNTDYVPTGTEFIITGGGMKGALGSNNVNGSTVGSISQMAITRHDDTTRFSAGSGPAVAPYFNLWVTDGMGNYAVLANEPSNASFASYRSTITGGGIQYDFSMADIASEPVKVYETPGWNTDSSWVHTLTGQTSATMTFADVLGLTVDAPSVAYVTNPINGVGSGAPDDINTSVAYGFNWVFGDTLSNYVSGAEGYVVSNPVLVPTPASAAILGLGGLAAVRRRR